MLLLNYSGIASAMESRDKIVRDNLEVKLTSRVLIIRELGTLGAPGKTPLGKRP